MPHLDSTLHRVCSMTRGTMRSHGCGWTQVRVGFRRALNSDLALISVAHENPVWLQFAAPEEGGIGADVIAIGTPKGFEWSVSKGIVSALREEGATRLVQTDAAINKGNSGGPLILLDSGRVIGVNALSFRKDGAVGLNFAVSAQTVIATFGPHLKR